MKKGSRWLNPLLFILLVCIVALCLVVPKRDPRQPNYEFLPEAQMAQSPAYDSFAPNPNFADGVTLRPPPTGTIARGHKPFAYAPNNLQEAERAGREVAMPYSDKIGLERGAAVFANFCQVCHGPLGEGNGPMTRGSFPPPASLTADRALRMRDGQMFYVLTFGQLNMPSFHAQLPVADRWSVILYIRRLQAPYNPAMPVLGACVVGLLGSPLGQETALTVSALFPGRTYVSTIAPTRSERITSLFNDKCARCHGQDGTGSSVRQVWPLIPDFTSPAWQMSQTEMAIVNQIDYGSAPAMPSFRYELTREEILGLAVYIRTFPLRPPTAKTPPSQPTAKYLYGSFCFSCHDANGKGNSAMRASMPGLPDFTATAWQESRTDADLTHSILEGKGQFMLPMKDRLGTIDVKEMVALVRGFKGGKQTVQLEAPKEQGPPPTADLTAPFSVSLVGLLCSPTGQSPLLAIAALSPGKTPKGEVPPVAPSPEREARLRVAANLFRQYCIVCHGLDGKGTQMRASMPLIPDFTSDLFYKQHSTDAQLQVSILLGKGPFMQPNAGGQISKEQARDLVAYVRTFGPTPVGDPNEPGDAEFERKYRQLEQQLDELHKEMEKVKARQ